MSAKPSAVASVSMCPASARGARLPVQRPPANSTSIVAAVNTSVTTRTDRERAAAVVRSWPCACIVAIVSGRGTDDRIRAMTRPLGILALGLVLFWLVAHLLWMGPVETAAETTAMFALGLLTGGVGIAATLLLALPLAAPGTPPAP